MLRSAASLVLRSALSSIAAADCFVSAAESATFRECLATARAVRSIGSDLGWEAMPEKRAARQPGSGRSALLGRALQPFQNVRAKDHHRADQDHAKRRGDAEQE